MSVPNVSRDYPSAGAQEAASRIPTKVLEQKDFLQLLVTQLTTQDPLNPKGDMDFMTQMTQFSSLEQAKKMAEDIQTLRSEGSIGQANSLLGRTVMLQKLDGSTTLGQVSGVKVDTGVPLILVNGQLYQLGQVLNIMPPPTPK